MKHFDILQRNVDLYSIEYIKFNIRAIRQDGGYRDSVKILCDSNEFKKMIKEEFPSKTKQTHHALI